MLLSELSGVGRDPAGGVTRFAWASSELELREWFTARASRLGLDLETDGNGNLWAWQGAELPGTAFVVGSHLDSVRSGGDWDGPLGVASAFAALESLRGAGWMPARPVAVVAFADEEGGRFGMACLGSRLLTGAVGPARALALVDDNGTTLADAMTAAGHDPGRVGADPARLARIGAFVELHIEQGRMPLRGAAHELSGARGLAGAGRPVGVAREIWPHGRWRIDLAGIPDHAGTTALADRVDPVLAMAEGIVEVRRAAAELGILATVGRVRVLPGAVNAIASSASMWVDARGEDPERVHELVALVERRLGVAAALESWTDITRFDAALTADVAEAVCGEVPELPSGAGHDAGVLSLAGLPTAMLFVRNPTGVSHSPEEHAEEVDASEGVAALTAVIRRMAS
ncbi:MAG TPA: allantoate amidohydrolase [Pseudolysinimonas sp.]|nr:allantoate amidohydrolase [Pseudolysinimonas sp.]